MLFNGGDYDLYGYCVNDPINFMDPLGLWEDPVEFWKDFAGGASDLYRNYQDMKDANTIGADKYFHCLANCQASRRGLGGEEAAEKISEGREWFDEKIKGDPPSACNADRAANNQGRRGNRKQSCKAVCGSLRPSGLNSKY